MLYIKSTEHICWNSLNVLLPQADVQRFEIRDSRSEIQKPRAPHTKYPPSSHTHIKQQLNQPANMKFLVTIAALCLFVAFAAGQQYFLGQFPSRARFGFDPVALAGPSSATQVRDPRQNRGPVVFPPSPPDAVDESSGVVVGASGYGFVPPQQRKLSG
ncbi:uncharacterized protein LOC108136704 isoform X2 [Drosophila elegans]|nr:uncharacterized protein LOC108136704 isoform X2 [Drosophila elegans]